MFGKVFTAEGDRVLAGLIQLVYNLRSRHGSDGHGISEGCLLKLFFFFLSCFIFCFYFEEKSANLSRSFYEMSRRFCTCSFYIIRELMQKRLRVSVLRPLTVAVRLPGLLLEGRVKFYS